jgi:PAS domain S-box-containing protein/putative nucleotidyltransferase with HDIG domain
MKKILVVDDEEQNISYLETLFKAHGFHVTTARNGAKALEAAREDPPHLIISDILMPVMDGFMLCKEWKNDGYLKNIPFIFYTATYTDPKDEKLAMEMGADLFVVKPQEPDILLNLVQKVMAQFKSKITKSTSEIELSEEAFLQEHNEALFRKLEKKIRQLEEANQLTKESETKYRSIFENSISGIYRSTKEGRLLSINSAFYRMLGYNSPEELRSLVTDIGIQLYVIPEDRTRLLELLEKNNSVEGFETRFYKKDHSIIWIKAGVWTIRDVNNNILYYEGIAENITDQVQREHELKTSAEKLKFAMMGTIHVIATIVEQRDPYTAGHQRRVSEIAAAIAEEMGLPSEQIEGIKIAGLIHDVGKIAIPTEILVKPGKLTPTERLLVEYHAEAGYNILKDVEFPWPILDSIHQHHERMNGSGYPSGLLNENITFEARILAIADVVEAMASHRPYRPAFEIDIALKEIEKNKGVLYDENAANACLNLFRTKNYKIV